LSDGFVGFLLLLCVVLPGTASAAFAPPAIYILPDYVIEKVEGDRLVLDSGDALRVNDWASWPDPAYVQDESLPRPDCDARVGFGSRVRGCSETYLIRFADDEKRQHNCRDADPIELVDRDSGESVRLETGLSGCDEVLDIQYYGGWVWVLAYLAGDHGDYSGKGLWRVDPDTGASEVVTASYGAWRDEWGSDVISSFAIHIDSRSVWLTSRRGLHRYDIDRGRWESRYYHIYLDEAQTLRAALQRDPQPHDELEMYSHLIEFYIPDRAGFIAAWQKTDEKPGQKPYINDDLAPFYLAALEAMPDNNSGSYQFSNLTSRLIEHDREKYLPILVKMIDSIDNLSRRSKLIKNLERHDYVVPKTVRSRLHDQFVEDFFEGQVDVYTLCRFYRLNNIDFLDIDPAMLANTGDRLQEIMNKCFSHFRKGSVSESVSQRFYRLYKLGDIESKAGLCQYLAQVRDFQLDSRFIRALVSDLSRKEYQDWQLRGPLHGLLIEKIHTGEQAVYLARLPESDPSLGSTVGQLLHILQRHHTFPELEAYWQAKSRAQADACRRFYTGETREAFAKRCRDKTPTLQPLPPGTIRLPPPEYSDKPFIIDRSR